MYGLRKHDDSPKLQIVEITYNHAMAQVAHSCDTLNTIKRHNLCHFSTPRGVNIEQRSYLHKIF